MGETPILTFGEELRRERLIRDVSLDEISASTKISIRLLTALEASDVKKLPAPVFTRGFIRAYSRHLGLDPDEMVNAYLADVAPEKSRAGAGGRRRGLRSLFRGRRGAAGTIVASVTGILILLGLIARPEQRAAPAASAAARPIAPVSFKNVGVSEGPAPTIQDATHAAPQSASPQNAAPAAEPAPPALSSGVSMVLEFQEDSWTEVSADGATVFTGLIRRGTTRRFEARDGFRLTLGNAGGVRVTVDGRALQPLGSAGQVVRDMPVPDPRLQS
jgi:cytoskeletal protein RodZ